MGLISATRIVVTSAERRGRSRIAQQGNRQWTIVIQAVNSQGWAVLPYIIVAGKNCLSNWYEDSPFLNNWRIVVSDNGQTKNKMGLDQIKHFDQHTRGRITGVYRLLILDSPESHHSYDFERYCKDNSNITLCMPSNSSRRLQPLDVGYFEPFEVGVQPANRGFDSVSQNEFILECYFSNA